MRFYRYYTNMWPEGVVVFVYEEWKEEMIDILMQRDLPLSGKVCSFSSAALVARQRLA